MFHHVMQLLPTHTIKIRIGRKFKFASSSNKLLHRICQRDTAACVPSHTEILLRRKSMPNAVNYRISINRFTFYLKKNDPWQAVCILWTSL